MPVSIAPRLCPLCGQPNTCAMELARSTGQPLAPCWCTTQTIVPATLARLAPEAVDQACLCPRCAALPGGTGR